MNASPEDHRRDEDRATTSMPRQLGAFSIGPILGEGGSGIVYAASRGEQAVALKVLREELALSPRDRRRFLEEADALRRAPHPAIVPLLEAGTLEDGRPYLAMPRLQGETLADRLTHGPLKIATAFAYFHTLADAVATIHEHGLVHRDIKPENVFLCRASGEERPILLDFGIARDADASRSTTTEQGRIRGTPAYMAPERFFGTAASKSTDIYELTVVLYMMLVGRAPWDAEGGAASRLHPKGPRELGVGISEEAEAIVLRALSTRPEVRPESARVLSASLRGDAVPSHPAVTAHVTANVSSAPRRSRVRIAVAAFGLSAGVAFGVGWAAVHRNEESVSSASSAVTSAPASRVVPANEPEPTTSAPVLVAASSSAPPGPTPSAKKPGTSKGAGRPVKPAEEPSGKVSDPTPVPTGRYYEDRK